MQLMPSHYRKIGFSENDAKNMKIQRFRKFRIVVNVVRAAIRMMKCANKDINYGREYYQLLQNYKQKKEQFDSQTIHSQHFTVLLNLLRTV